MTPLLDTPPHHAIDWGIVAIFAVVYLGMFLGGLPKLKLDRSGVALLGVIADYALRVLPPVALSLTVLWLECLR